MNRSVRTFIAIILCILFASCSNQSLKYFDQRMIDEYGWTEDEIKKIQFFTSEDIVLWRELANNETTISNGQIRIDKNSRIEEVIIKRNTPGVVVFIPKFNKYAVSFDPDGKYLMFGKSKKRNNRYVLLAKDWDRQYGKVTYGDHIYNTKSSSAFASLLVDIKRAGQVRKKSKNARGRIVN